MRLIDADDLYDNMLYEMCGTGYQTLALQVIRRAPTIEIDTPNDPLTISELREMEGMPVWVRGLYDVESGWHILERTGPSNTRQVLHYESYGKTWVAYPRNPEEE